MSPFRHMALCLGLTGLIAACGSGGDPAAKAPDPVDEAAADAVPLCEPVIAAPEKLPGVEARHLTLEYWLETIGKKQRLDEVLLTTEDVRALNAGMAVPREKYHSQRNLLEPVDLDDFAEQVASRRKWAREKLEAGDYVHGDGEKFTEEELAELDSEVALGQREPELFVALEPVQLYCAPIEDDFFSPALDPRLSKNSCSRARPQEVIQVLDEWPNGMKLAQTRYAFGWIAGDATLSPAIPESLRPAYVTGARVQTLEDLEFEPKRESKKRRKRGKRGKKADAGVEQAAEAPAAKPVEIRAGTLLPVADRRGRQAHVATAAGFFKTPKKFRKNLQSARRELTRRALLQEAWRYFGTPYGLGGTEGGRDCSRFLLDTFESFDVHLPRHSSWQARAGSFWIEVGDIGEKERLLLIDSAAEKGIVLLHFPGHIMLYLGRDDRDQPMVLHAFREYLQRCEEGGPDTVVRVDDLTVSNLELGRGTERKAFIERITHVTVIGKPPGVELGGVAQLRPVPEPAIPPNKNCRDSRHAAMYISPAKPNERQPVRVIASLSRDPGPTSLIFVDPDGKRVAPETVRLGGPPFGFVGHLDKPHKDGRWKAVLADGERVVACKRFWVSSRKPKLGPPTEGPIWKPIRKWTVSRENLYALFVERLFDYPIDEDVVWPNLHTLLRDPKRNILHDHLGLDEDEAIELEPDCADLPYTLRAYFAWKMRLPFGYRRCTRARDNSPPDCDKPEGGDNLMSRLELRGEGGYMQPQDDIAAFSLFVNTKVRRAVHSSSGRTAPDDDLSDFYPVALTRRDLRPGTLFADPYGHLLVVADWIPQGIDKYGILVGVDAQPDGTVGRRRFWRGSFLFDPDTKGGGAGFKVFRPREFFEEPVAVEVEIEDQLMPIERIGYTEEIINEDLRKTRKYVRHSMQQYRGTADDFYNAMEGLINPRPLDPEAMQLSLVDALAEAVARRVTSVNNGEKFMADNQYETVEMPEKAAIFLTSGPWEDFSTPSRDLRLLISIDSVMAFPRTVRAAPERYALRPGEVDAEIGKLKSTLERALKAKTFTYTRSDGSETTLSLEDVVDRSELFEMAYNPNDCVEIRWAAAPGSDEMATCQRHAPEEQRQRMESYRDWFATRKRPAR